MTKTWRCTKCQSTVSKGLVQSRSGPPDECEVCQNEEFEEVGVTGRLHRFVDQPGNTLQSKRTRRRVLTTSGGGIAALAGAWWFFGRAEIEQTTEVALRNSQFHPRNIEIDVGDEVTWTNDEEEPEDIEGQVEVPTYLIQSATPGWEFEAELGEGESVSHTFEDAGIYALYDEIFGDEDLNDMSMKIGVGEEIEDPVGGWF